MVTGENSAMNSDGDEDEIQEVHEIKDDSESDDGIMEVDQDDPLTAKASKGSMMDPETGEYKGVIKGPDGKLVKPSTIVSTEVKKPQVCNYFYQNLLLFFTQTLEERLCISRFLLNYESFQKVDLF